MAYPLLHSVSIWIKSKSIRSIEDEHVVDFSQVLDPSCRGKLNPYSELNSVIVVGLSAMMHPTNR